MWKIFWHCKDFNFIYEGSFNIKHYYYKLLFLTIVWSTAPVELRHISLHQLLSKQCSLHKYMSVFQKKEHKGAVQWAHCVLMEQNTSENVPFLLLTVSSKIQCMASFHEGHYHKYPPLKVYIKSNRTKPWLIIWVCDPKL